MQLGQRQSRDPSERPLVEPVEVGRQRDPGATVAGGQRRVGPGEGIELGVAAVEHQRRLVELDLGHARGRQAVEQLAVDDGQRLEHGHRIEVVRARGRLGQQQQRERAEHHRAQDLVRARDLAGLGHVRQPATRPQPERLVGRQLGDKVVVVRVQPLRHLERGRVGVAAAGQEVPAQGVGGVDDGALVGTCSRHHPRLPSVALRHDPDQLGRVEHVVVERVVADRQDVDPGLPGASQVLRAQRAGGRLQLLGRELAGPVGLQRELQLTVGANAGKTKHSGACHLIRLLLWRP